MANNKKFNADIVFFRIDDCYLNKPVDIYDDDTVKEIARMGWRANLGRHPKVKYGYVVYDCEVIRKFKLINYAPIMLPPDKKHKKVRERESMFIEFVNDPNDKWLHTLINFDKQTYINPIFYDYDNWFRRNHRDHVLFQYYRELKYNFKRLESYFNNRRLGISTVKRNSKKISSSPKTVKRVKAPRVPSSKRPTRKK